VATSAASSSNNKMKQDQQLLVNIKANNLKVDSFKLPLYNDKNEAVFTNNNDIWDGKKQKHNGTSLLR